jgi:hypothetical protein
VSATGATTSADADREGDENETSIATPMAPTDATNGLYIDSPAETYPAPQFTTDYHLGSVAFLTVLWQH